MAGGPACSRSQSADFREDNGIAICQVYARFALCRATGLGATLYLMKTLSRVARNRARPVLAHNLTRVTNIVGVQPLMVPTA